MVWSCRAEGSHPPERVARREPAVPPGAGPGRSWSKATTSFRIDPYATRCPSLSLLGRRLAPHRERGAYQRTRSPLMFDVAIRTKASSLGVGDHEASGRVRRPWSATGSVTGRPTPWIWTAQPSRACSLTWSAWKATTELQAARWSREVGRIRKTTSGPLRTKRMLRMAGRAPMLSPIRPSRTPCSSFKHSSGLSSTISGSSLTSRHSAPRPSPTTRVESQETGS